MIKNFFKVALRSIIRNKTLTFINIAGLSAGISAFILLLLFVRYELGYDRQHPESENIYRIIQRIQRPDKIDEYAISPATYAPAMKEMFPEVKDFTRFTYYNAGIKKINDNKVFDVKRFAFADSNFLKFFNFPLLAGNTETALKNPYSLVLTKEAASKFFPDENPVGKTVRVSNLFTFTITGVLKNKISQTHLSFDVLASFSTLYVINEDDAKSINLASSLRINNSGFSAYMTYVLLKQDVDYKSVENKMGKIVDLLNGPGRRDKFKPILQPVTNIHLSSNYIFELSANSSYLTVYSFLTIALFILLIACVNYMNLSTAQYSKRAKEVGIRKVLGSDRNQLIYQFIVESVVITSVSILLSIGFVSAFLPKFNELFEKNIELNFANDPQIILYLLLVWIVTGFISGGYPSFFLSNFQPVKVLKGKFSAGRGSAFFRKSLVVFQFTISSILITVTLFVGSQLNYIQNKDLGYNKDQVAVITLNSDWMRNNFKSIKTQLLSYPGISDVSASSSQIGTAATFFMTALRKEGSDDDLTFSISAAGVDYNFLNMLDIKIIEGRNFNEDFISDTSEAFLLNEAAVKMIGKDQIENTFVVNNPLGGRRSGKIVGIFKDIIHTSLHHSVEPLLLHADPRSFNFLYVKLNGNSIKSSLGFLGDKWREWLPEHPFQFQFLDDNFDLVYAEEQKQGKILNSFAVFAIFISCLGLWGLASFSVEQKRKEVSIRKVLGASPISIIINLLKQYFVFVTISFLISIPAVWYAVDSWLSNFAYRIDVNPVYFFAGAVIVFGITVGTVMYHVLISVRINPAVALKAE